MIFREAKNMRSRGTVFVADRLEASLSHFSQNPGEVGHPVCGGDSWQSLSQPLEKGEPRSVIDSSLPNRTGGTVKKRLALLLCLSWSCWMSAEQAPNKPVLYIPFNQPEFAYNLVKECPAVDVTFIQEKAQFAVSWGMNERENRNDCVLFSADGKVVGSGETMRVSAAARDICKAVAAK